MKSLWTVAESVKAEELLTEDEKLNAQYKLFEAQNRSLQMENDLLKKIEENRKKAILSEVRYEDKYLSIQELSNKDKYPIAKLCNLGSISKSSYYKWLHREKRNREFKNEELLKLICELYEETDGIFGYRQMTIKIRREYNKTVNHKRIYRLMKILGLKSVCRKKRNNYIKSTPEVTAENILNRNSKQKKPMKNGLQMLPNLNMEEVDKRLI